MPTFVGFNTFAALPEESDQRKDQPSHSSR